MNDEQFLKDLETEYLHVVAKRYGFKNAPQAYNYFRKLKPKGRLPKRRIPRSVTTHTPERDKEIYHLKDVEKRSFRYISNHFKQKGVPISPQRLCEIYNRNKPLTRKQKVGH